MPSYVPPPRATEFIFYTALVSQSTRPQFQNNPTLVAGDVLVSTDGNATTNLDTLPTVTPASGDQVKVTVSIAEMTGDNITVKFSDAAGAEWDDQIINIQTSVRLIDELCFPTTVGRSLTIEADGVAHADVKEWLGVAPLALMSQRVNASVGAMQANVLTTTAIANAAFTNAKFAINAISGTAIALTAAEFAADTITSTVLASTAVNKIRDAILSDATTFPGAAITALRLAELDPANLPTDIADIPTVAEFNARTILTAAYFDPAVDPVAVVTAVTGLTAANLDVAVSTRATPAQVNTEVLDVMTVDTMAEPSQAIPPTTGVATMLDGIRYAYFALTNRVDSDTTANFLEFHNRAATVVQWKKAISDDGSIFTEGTGAAGP